MSRLKDIANKAAENTKDKVRKTAQFYLDNRDRIDAGALAYPLAQNAARTSIAKTIAGKTILGLGAGALAVKAFPFAAAGAAIYYGPDLVKKAQNFMAQGEAVKKAAKGDLTSARGIADMLAEKAAGSKDNAPPEPANDDKPAIEP